MKNIKLLTGLTILPILTINIFPLTSCNKSSKSKYGLLVQECVTKLVEMNKYPRCTSNGIRHNLDGIRTYITQEAIKMGLAESDVCTDNYGNLWFDVPATTGCESYEPLILQAHMDMVVAGLENDKKAITPIDTQIEWSKGLVHSKDYKTSLGADDGAGVAIALTLLQDKSIAHGPIRVLCSADEDSGMLGAASLCKNKKLVLNKMGKNFEGRDIKYLLNIDYEDLGQISKSCAGSITYVYANYYEISSEEQLPNNFYINIDGFLGGHSGIDVVKNRANADKCLYEILKQIIDNGNSVQIIKNYHPKDGKDVSFARNQIVSNANVVFNTNADKQTIQGYIDTLVSQWKTNYSGEDWGKVSVKIDDYTQGNDSKYLSSADSNKIITMLGKNTVPSLSEADKSIWFGYILNESGLCKISANIAPCEINFDSSANKIKLNITTQTRMSDSDETLPTYNLIKTYYKNVKIGDLTPTISSDYTPWVGKAENKMVDWCQESFQQQGIQTTIVDDIAGIEPTWWQQCNSSLQCTAIGPDIIGAHSQKETLKIDSIQPILEVCKFLFAKMGQ